MAQRKIPARDFIGQVRAADGSTWVDVGGLNNIVVNPSEAEEETDTTTHASAGQYEHLKMQRGASLQLQGMMLKDNITGVQDTGQLRCETLAAATAYASLGAFRFRHPADTLWKVWAEATFSLGEQGGGNNDMTSWACTVKRSGASSTAPVV